MAEQDLTILQQLHQRYMEECIRPIIYRSARELVAGHRGQGHTLLIITTTNRFITEPIAAEFVVDNLLATEPEIVDGRFTGQVSGIPCFREGKVQRLNQWLAGTRHTLEDNWFYQGKRGLFMNL